MSETNEPASQPGPLAEPVDRGPHVSRRAVLGAAGLAGAAGMASQFGLLAARADAATPAGTLPPGPYSPTWESVDQHTAAPEWFQDAKFGIYFHWGVYSVPAFHDEWYPHWMYDTTNSGGVYQHHRQTYGDPSTVFPYNNFIDGGYDLMGNYVQFKPQLKSQGGNFDPHDWAQLFKAAGAKFAGPVAEHCDGFSMWDSQVNEWNAVKRGPQLDLVKLHSQAIRGQGLKFIMTMHNDFDIYFTQPSGLSAWYQGAPPQPTESLRKLFYQLPRNEELQLWFDKMREVIDGYQPDLIYNDYGLHSFPEDVRLQFLAYYYNRAAEWGKDVVVTYKDGLDTSGEVYDFERGGAGSLLTPYWETDDALSPSTWCYVSGISYYPAKTLLHSLIDHVSKGGNLLLDIAPMADGTIPSDQRSILLGIGDYLGRFGESIYATRIWSTYGEGPTAMGGGTFSGPRAGTPQDIRFTRNKGNNRLYVTALGWQGSTMTVQSLNSSRFSISNLQSAQLLDNTAGKYISLPKPAQDASGLHFSMPSGNPPFDALAYVVKLDFQGQIPALTPLACVTPTTPDALVDWTPQSGDTISDSSAYGRNATIVGGGLYTSQPGGQPALVLDGNRYVRTTDAVNLGQLSQATFAATIRVDSSGSYRRLFDYIVPGSAGDVGFLVDLSSGNQVRFIGDKQSVQTTATVPEGTFTKLTVTIAGDGTLTVYLNGAPAWTGSLGANPLINACAALMLQFGADQAGSERLIGAVGEMTIWPTALSPDVIAGNSRHKTPQGSQ